jgi:pyridoxamine 5'-phosphate oxidase
MQSEPVPDRKYLDDQLDKIKTRFHDRDIPRPSYWGGYKLIPSYFEFWQGREGRMHDRIAYSLENKSWTISRLSP